MAKKKESSQTGTEPQADEPAVSEPGKEKVKAPTSAGPGEVKPGTRTYRGQVCKILKTVRSRKTGTVYDVIEYTRSITNRRDGKQEFVKLGLKLRRIDTGNDVATQSDEEVIE